MDISCIISSGDLELYLLGLLPAEEAYVMEQLLLLFPELREEADRISETLALLAHQTERAPQAGVREKVLEQLSALQQLPQPEESGTPVVALPQKEYASQPAGAKSHPLSKRNYQLAAMVAGLLLCVAAIIALLSENRQKQNNIAALQQSVQSANQNVATLQARDAAYAQLLQLVQNAQVTAITLAAVPGKPAAAAKVFWNQQTNEVYVLNGSLPQAPAGKQYQLWAIVNGKPVSAGLLGRSTAGAQKMASFAKADAFAITLEKEGGSPTPTMEQLYVMGKIS